MTNALLEAAKIANLQFGLEAGPLEVTEGDSFNAVVTCLNTGPVGHDFGVYVGIGKVSGENFNVEAGWYSTGVLPLVAGGSGEESLQLTAQKVGTWDAIAIICHHITAGMPVVVYDQAVLVNALVVKSVYTPPSAAWGYDFNGNGYIDSDEVAQANYDYSVGLITEFLRDMVNALYNKHVRHGQLKGDFDDDGDIDYDDFVAFANCYDTVLGDPKYHPIGDFDDDGDIDIYDYVAFAAVYSGPTGSITAFNLK